MALPLFLKLMLCSFGRGDSVDDYADLCGLLPAHIPVSLPAWAHVRPFPARKFPLNACVAIVVIHIERS